MYVIRYRDKYREGFLTKYGFGFKSDLPAIIIIYTSKIIASTTCSSKKIKFEYIKRNPETTIKNIMTKLSSCL